MPKIKLVKIGRYYWNEDWNTEAILRNATAYTSLSRLERYLHRCSFEYKITNGHLVRSTNADHWVIQANRKYWNSMSGQVGNIKTALVYDALAMAKLDLSEAKRIYPTANIVGYKLKKGA